MRRLARSIDATRSDYVEFQIAWTLLISLPAATIGFIFSNGELWGIALGLTVSVVVGILLGGIWIRSSGHKPDPYGRDREDW